jgi:hypothetical protein
MKLWLQVNTRGAWRHVFSGGAGEEDRLLAMVARMAQQQPEAKWCLLYGSGRRRYIQIDRETGRAYLPAPPPEAA